MKTYQKIASLTRAMENCKKSNNTWYDITVKVSGNSVIVLNTRTGFYKQHDIHEFVYGQIHYNEETEKYPNYVHGEVWRQWDNN